MELNIKNKKDKDNLLNCDGGKYIFAGKKKLKEQIMVMVQQKKKHLLKKKKTFKLSKRFQTIITFLLINKYNFLPMQ